MQPRVGIANLKVESRDGTFTIGREAFPHFSWLSRLGVHIQSDQVRVASPDAVYLETAITTLAEACLQLGVAEAEIAFVDTVIPPPTSGLRYGFKGAFTTDRPNVIWVFANWTSLEELRVAGLDGDVTVLRDDWGVPHIFATTNHDLFLALGYVHAQDRMWQMDVQYRFAAGRLSEVLGGKYVDQDTFLRTVGIARFAERYLATLAPGDLGLATLEAYSAGVNAWIARTPPRDLPLEFRLLGYAPEPWTPLHSLTEGGLLAYQREVRRLREIVRGWRGRLRRPAGAEAERS